MSGPFEYVFAAWLLVALVLLGVAFIASAMEVAFSLTESEKATQKAKRLTTAQRAWMDWALVVLHFVGLAGICALPFAFIPVIFGRFEQLGPWLIGPALAAAVLLYRLRGVRPLLYGLIEVTAGVGLLLAVVIDDGSGLRKVMAMAAGVYFIVRGLDNVEKGLPERALSVWLILFPKERRTS